MYKYYRVETKVCNNDANAMYIPPEQPSPPTTHVANVNIDAHGTLEQQILRFPVRDACLDVDVPGCCVP